VDALQHRPLPEGAVVLVMQDEITVVVPSAQSEGRCLVVQIGVPPGGGPPPLHTHPPDELFHVMEGDITVFRRAGEHTERLELGQGDTILIPGGVPHTFRNLSAKPGRLLCTFSPGPMMEAFFSMAGRPAGADVADPHAEVGRVLGIGASIGMVTLDEVPG
jgi:mannose-6-phosphate isomerase-like protein (cupin superfamily)